MFFNSKNNEQTRFLKKLDYKFYRLYEVENLVNKQIYYLKLSGSMKIHNMFYVLLLKLYRNILENAQPLPIEVKGESEHYKIKKS